MGISPEIPQKVAVVCVGNICRSPVGEALLREYVGQSSYPIQHIHFDSAGLFGGRLQIAEDSVHFLQQRGISTESFKSKQTTQEFLDQNDLIIVMERYMKEFIITTYYSNFSPTDQKKILERIFTLQEVAGSKGEIPDPFHTSSKNFHRILQNIDVACQTIVKRWENCTKPKTPWRRFEEKIKTLFQ